MNLNNVPKILSMFSRSGRLFNDMSRSFWQFLQRNSISIMANLPLDECYKVTN